MMLCKMLSVCPQPVACCLYHVMSA